MENKELIQRDTLQQILQENTQLSQRAVCTLGAEIESVKNINLRDLEVLEGDKIEEKLNGLHIRADEAIRINKKRRTPFTKRLDEIRAQFTKAENDIQLKIDEIKAWRAAWNAEKHARDAEARQRSQSQLDKQNALTEFAAAVKKSIYETYIVEVTNMIDRLNQAFYANRIEDFPEYEKRLKGYAPTFEPFPFKVPEPHPLLSPGEGGQVLKSTTQTVFAQLKPQYEQKIAQERDRLISCIEARKAELSDEARAKEAEERIKKEQKERNGALQKEREILSQSADAQKEIEQMNNSFESLSAQPATQLSKGATIKRKYEVVSHAGFLPIIQHWVKHDLNLLTLDEVKKKLSFMFTSANKSLNEGSELKAEGLNIIEDFTTRKTNKK